MLVQESWSYSALTINFDDNTKNLAINPAFSSQYVCDTARWTDASGCNGIDRPWAFGTATLVSGTATGKVRAWHYLAETASADKSLLLSIEKTDVLQFFIHEYTAPSYNG